MDAAREGFPPRQERRARPRSDAARARHHDAIYTLARASESHDEETGAHLLRIRTVVERVALRMGFAPENAERLGYDAMLHDVGKLTVPPSILTKREALTSKEWAALESHAVRGERLLSARPSMERASRIARSHHEAWDGSGYPDGLAGDAIPIEARITAAADVLDALIADRAYKRRWSLAEALGEVRRLAGSRLDPAVVAAIEACDLHDVYT